MMLKARLHVQQMGIDDSISTKFVQANAGSEFASLFEENKLDIIIDM